MALNEDLSKVNIQVQSNTSTNDIDVNEIYENLVNKLKRKSENNYFQERCTGGCKQTEFWKTMKPYFSKKSCRCIFLGNNYFQIFFLTYLLNFFLICTVPSF
jgi:hypothetical protein